MTQGFRIRAQILKEMSVEGEKGEEHLKKMMNSVYGEREREREKKERKEGFHGFCVLAELGSVFEQNKGSPDLTTCQRSRTKNFKTARAELRIRSSGLNQQPQSFFCSTSKCFILAVRTPN